MDPQAVLTEVLAVLQGDRPGMLREREPGERLDREVRKRWDDAAVSQPGLVSLLPAKE
jgi:hypothetical protein